jgi:hypothetical protein
MTLLFLSCATQRPGVSPGFDPVYVTNRAAYFLLPPGELETPLDMAQQISGQYGKEAFIMDAWVEADAARLTIALFNTLGTGMGDLNFREGELSFSSPYFPPSLKAEYIVADFQFCFYREAPLRRALEDCGLSLELLRGPGRELRTIREGETIIIEIVKTPEEVRYTNHIRGYAYTLRGAF